jgi:uncharacterized protein YegP (UPF0339 family)
MEEIFNSVPLSFMIAPGNHDAKTSGSEENLISVYSEYYGDTYYNFAFGNTQFYSLSTEEESYEGMITGDELAWLEDNLSNSVYENLITFYHRPIELPEWSTAQSFTSEENKAEVLALLQNYNVNLSINGHIHTYDYRELGNGLYQLITANAGLLARDEDQYHFSLINVNGEIITPTEVMKDGFNVDVEYLGYNDGTEDEILATITNSAAADLPYLRLKFKLAAGEKYYAYDDSGNAIDLVSHNFGDYSVVYIEASVVALESKTITVKRSTKIQTGLTNTIDANGEITYSTLPTSDINEMSDFSIIPSDNLEVTIDKWQTKKIWQENSTSQVTAVYAISDLTSNQRY